MTEGWQELNTGENMILEYRSMLKSASTTSTYNVLYIALHSAVGNVKAYENSFKTLMSPLVVVVVLILYTGESRSTVNLAT